MARRSKRTSDGLGDVAMKVRANRAAVKSLDGDPSPAVKRAMLAEFCRFIGEQSRAGTPVHGTPPATDAAATAAARHRVEEIVALSPRMRQTLAALLAGDSEKQVALRLRLSPHTIHVYVKSLYRHFNVSSRGELLARWVDCNPLPVTVIAPVTEPSAARSA